MSRQRVWGWILLAHLSILSQIWELTTRGGWCRLGAAKDRRPHPHQTHFQISHRLGWEVHWCAFGFSEKSQQTLK